MRKIWLYDLINKFAPNDVWQAGNFNFRNLSEVPISQPSQIGRGELVGWLTAQLNLSTASVRSREAGSSTVRQSQTSEKADTSQRLFDEFENLFQIFQILIVVKTIMFLLLQHCHLAMQIIL